LLSLYHNDKSTCSQKVRICLAELNLEWENKHINLLDGEHLSPEYLKINPNGVVPALLHNEDIIIESTVICEYLCEVFPGQSNLTPKHPLKRAEMRAWLRYIDEVPSQAIRIVTYNSLAALFKDMSKEEYVAHADRMPLRKHFFLRFDQSGFSEFETNAAMEQLQQTIMRMEKKLKTDPWLTGGQYTNADICLLPIFVRLEDLGLTKLWQKQKAVSDWFQRATDRPAFKTAYYEGSRMVFNLETANK